MYHSCIIFTVLFENKKKKNIDIVCFMETSVFACVIIIGRGQSEDFKSNHLMNFPSVCVHLFTGYSSLMCRNIGTLNVLEVLD